MQQFQETAGQILIMAGATQLQMSLSEFQKLEPEYPALAAPYVWRRWQNPGLACCSDGNTQYAEVFDGAPYCASIAEYQRRLTAVRYVAPITGLIEPDRYYLISQEDLRC